MSLSQDFKTLLPPRERSSSQAGIPLLNDAGGHQPAVITRLEELLSANCDRPLHMSEICAATGVSERTLRQFCRKHLGMAPVRYLWLRRMQFARAALMRADPATATVTEIATSHGFWELGRFSVAYRTLFGESPSASLRRYPDAFCDADAESA
ncbi:MAG TPA: helix-turn-helix transcriptional regulator [Pseudolabrys sp.]|jgi:transcriptional regulator GlxA family with amidase domain|nr:helix-turn-helix transcriptional regulator [Pseudolabrys sp.]